MNLSPKTQKFILHWGEMGPRWGINRTVAQIHALLYLSSDPLTAEEIATTLSVARSNVSNSLRELQAWGLVRTVHKLGDRRDYFEVMEKDVWEMFRIILDERKKRETDPTVALLRECVAEKGSGHEDPHAEERLRQILEFFETMTSLYERLQGIPTKRLATIATMGDGFLRFVGGRGVEEKASAGDH